MPYGLQNASVYLDDILICSTLLQQHLDRLKGVLQSLRDTKLKVQLNKSESLRKEVAYLGHIFTPQDVKPIPNESKSVKHYSLSKTERAIKGFLRIFGC